MIRSRTFGCKWSAAFAAALLTLSPAKVYAEAIPAKLAGMTGALWQEVETKLKPAPDASPAERHAIEKTAKLLRDMRIRFFPKDTPVLKNAGPKLAQAFGLDWANAKDRAQISRLLAMPIKEAERQLAKTLEGDALTQAVSALSSVKSAGDGKTEWSQIAESGETVTVTWRPETGKFDVSVYDGTDGERYQTSVAAQVNTSLDPESGQLNTTLEVEDAPVSVLTEADFVEISRSIWGEWRDKDGWVWAFSPMSEADQEAGELEPTAAEKRQEIERLKAKKTEIASAKEYIWHDPTTDELVRQESFRRLSDPWVFKGEKPLIADAETKIAELDAEIAALDADLSGDNLLPMERDDPVAYEQSAADGAIAVNILTTLPDGHSFDWPEATFDGRVIRARRTYTDVRDSFNDDLPAEVIAQLVASWSPPSWILVGAQIDTETRALTLEGEFWALHVTYSQGMFSSGATVKSTHTPFPSALAMSKASDEVAYKSDWGAEDTALP